jgi:hypothetical protein
LHKDGHLHRHYFLIVHFFLHQRRRYAAIEFDNKLLLERLATIVQHKTIDNEIHKSVESHAKFKKKLVLTKKRLEMQKITEENQRVLKRIQEVPPVYSRIEWEEQAKIHETHRRGMAIYPEYYDRLEKEKRETREEKRRDKLLTQGGFSSGAFGSSGEAFRNSGSAGAGDFTLYSPGPGTAPLRSSSSQYGTTLPSIHRGQSSPAMTSKQESILRGKSV